MDKPRILFLDDEQEILDGYRRILHKKAETWKMYFFTDPDKALTFLADNYVGILLVDIKMPSMDGIAFIEELKKRFDDFSFQIIIVSGVDEHNARMEAFKLNVMDYLDKPVDQYELIARIENAITICKYQKSLKKQKEMLELELSNSQRMELVGYMAAGAVHDLKNIFGSMQLLSELIQMEAYENEKINNLLDRMFTGISHADELVHQLLTLRRLDDDAQVEEVDLVKTIEDCINISFPNRKIREGVVFSKNVDLLKVKINKVHAFQLFANLFVNAYEATKQGGKVFIDLKKDDTGEKILVKIKDEGVGIDQKTLKHLFELHYSNKESNRNYGLGLFVVSWILKQYEGTINVHSILGKGTEMEIKIPISR